MENFNLLVMLSLTTLTLVVAIGIFLRLRVAKAKRRHEHSALMDDPRMTHTERRASDTHTAVEGGHARGR